MIHSDLYKNNLLPSYYYLLPLTTLYINVCKLLHLYIMFFYMYSNCLCCVLCWGCVLFSVFSCMCVCVFVSVRCSLLHRCCYVLCILYSVLCVIFSVLHLCCICVLYLCMCVLCSVYVCVHIVCVLCAYCVCIVCVRILCVCIRLRFNSIRYPPCWLPMRVYGKNY